MNLYVVALVDKLIFNIFALSKLVHSKRHIPSKAFAWTLLFRDIFSSRFWTRLGEQIVCACAGGLGYRLAPRGWNLGGNQASCWESHMAHGPRAWASCFTDSCWIATYVSRSGLSTAGFKYSGDRETREINRRTSASWCDTDIVV